MSLARTAHRPAQPVGTRAETAAKMLYRELKAEIVSIGRKPGEPIVEREIASSFGVSRTPVREAILRLADEALVDIFPQSGTFVAKIPLASLPEAILVRKALEQLTAAQHKAAEAMYRQQAQPGASASSGPAGGGAGAGGATSSESKSDVIDAEVVDEEKK